MKSEKVTGALPVQSGPLTGAMKAALWLLSAEEEVAVGTLALLSSEEVVQLRQAVEGIQKVSPEQLAAIHGEFQRLMEEQPLRLRGSVAYLERLAGRALGEDKASAIMNPRDTLPPATALMDADVNALASLLAEEHPQVVAAVLATLTPQRASEVLMQLPDAARNDVVARVARLNKVPQTSLARAQQVISAGLPVVGGHDYDVDGVRIAATLLNQLDKERAEGILTAIAEGTTNLAAEVRQAMFTFEDLEQLDRRGMQALLKEVSSENLMMSLKAASDTMKNKVFESLSKRASEMMREDMQLMPPARLADVEKAQTEIVNVALRLRDEGKITIVGQGGDFV